jgi:subtilase family serine protease
MKNINRNRQRGWLLVALCALSVVPASPLAAQTRTEEARQQLKGHLTPEMSKAPLGARLTPTTQLTFTVGLVIPNNAELDQLAEQISDPQSPLYRKYLTPEQFADRFGATRANYRSVVDWAQSNHLTATTHRNRLVVTVTGAVADIESALNVHLYNRSRADGTQFYAPDVEPSIKLSVPVEHIGGLDDFSRPVSASGSGSGGSYQGDDFRNAYAPNMTLTGKGQSIGIFMFNEFAQSDINGYGLQTGHTYLPVKVIPAKATLNPGTEGTLDVEAALSMSPAAQIVGFVGTSSNPTAILTNMADHTEIKQFSSSWFWANGTTTDANLMQQMATQGQSFFQASGDNGPYAIGWLPTYTSGTLDCRQFPSITVVGGTVLNMNGNGGSYGTLETAWPGSSGGIITSVPIPSYQTGLAAFSGAVPGLNGASTTYRNQPDVSAQAADILIFYEGGTRNASGTSLATPLWAGYMALVNELAANAGNPAVGFANPALYLELYRILPSTYDANFHDIVSGCNRDKSGNQYCAGTDYDLVTGLGSPQHTLIYTLSGVSSEPLYCQGPLKTISGSTPLTSFTWASQAANLASPGPGECAWADRLPRSAEIKSGNSNVISGALNRVANLPSGKFGEIGVYRDPTTSDMVATQIVGLVSPPFSSTTLP